MKVLVLWADNRSANFGVRVLAEGMAALARRAWGESCTVDFQDFGKGDSDVSFGARTILRDVTRRHGPIRTKLLEYDVILDSGAGDSFTDIYGLKRLATMLYAQRTAFRLRLPVVMGPQTVGPFKSVITRLLAGRHLRRMDAVVTRDSKSAAFTVSLGRSDQELSTDVVFALPRDEVARSRDVVVNVSGLLWFGDDHVDSARYRSSVRELAEGLHAQGRTVTFLAHVVNKVSSIDDKAAITELMSDLSFDAEFVVPLALAEVRQVVGSARVVIGARMHACLNALSMGTPAIPWAYSRKFAPLLEDIGWSHVFDLREDEDIVAKTVHLIEDQQLAKMNDDVAGVLRAADERLGVAVRQLRRVGHAAG